MMYDLRINSRGNAEPMSYGFFEKCNKLSMRDWNDDDYTFVGKYRIAKIDANTKAIQSFLSRAEREGKLYE